MPIGMIPPSAKLSITSLAAAALYFDRLIDVRARPENSIWKSWDAHPWSSDRSSGQGLKEELRELGILKTVYVDQEAMEQISQPLIQAIGHCADELRLTKSFDGPWPSRENERAFTLGGKWTPRVLKDAILNNQLGFYKLNVYLMDEWLRMPSIIGRIYYSMLVESIAKDYKSSCIGDRLLPRLDVPEWNMESIVQILSSDRHHVASQSGRNLGARLGMLSVKALIPAPGQNISAHKIKRIRDRNRSELTAFQNYMQEIFAADGDGPIAWGSGDALHEYLAVQYERQIYPGLLELQNSLRGLGIASIWGAISMKAAIPPSIATAIAATLPASWASGATLGAGLAIGLAGVFSDHAKAVQEARKTHPQAYLLSVQKESALSALGRLRSIKPPSSLS